MWLCVKKLQWSHALTRVETLYLSATLGVEYSASMEPRTHARGNEVNELIRAGVIRASMEPRTHARGNQPFRDQVFRLADGFNGATHSRAWKRLTRLWPTRRVIRFNGATHSRAWKREAL